MRRIRTVVMALLTVFATAVCGGVGPARADTTGFSLEFDEPSAPHASGTCNNLYCTSFPYGVWSPSWELRVYPAPGGTPTSVRVQWVVGEVKPADPKHVVAGIDLQVDMGHGWQEVPDGPTAAVTVPSTATYSSPYILYFRFKPILDAQQAVRVCATLLWKGASAQQSSGSCTDNLTFTGTPPRSQPTTAPSATHTSPTSAASSTSPTRATPTTTPAATPALTPTPTTPSVATASPTPTVTSMAAESATETISVSPATDASPTNSFAATSSATASHTSSGSTAALLAVLGIVIAGGATTMVLVRRRRGRS